MSNKEYIDIAMSKAIYRMLEDGTIFGEIPGFTGVWANEMALERCQRVLQKVLNEWLYLKHNGNEEIPLLVEDMSRL